MKNDSLRFEGYVVKESHSGSDVHVLRTDREVYWLEINGEIGLHFGTDGKAAVEQHDRIIKREDHEVVIKTRKAFLS